MEAPIHAGFKRSGGLNYEIFLRKGEIFLRKGELFLTSVEKFLRESTG